jgi:hypothetical protein
MSFLSVEKMIPHIHTEEGIETLPNFGLTKTQHPQKEKSEKNESYHSSFCELSDHKTTVLNKIYNSNNCILYDRITIPKLILTNCYNSINYIFIKSNYTLIKYYSSKSPPFNF